MTPKAWDRVKSLLISVASSLFGIKCLLKRREGIWGSWAICPMRVGMEKGYGPERGKRTVVAMPGPLFLGHLPG